MARRGRCAHGTGAGGAGCNLPAAAPGLAAGTALAFLDTLAAAWLGASAPWLLLAAAVLGLAEAADRVLVPPPAAG